MLHNVSFCTYFFRCSNDKKAGYTIKVSFHKSSPLSSGKEVVQEIKNLTEVLLEAHKKLVVNCICTRV